MRVAVTGTPGTGKTTATECLDAGLDLDFDLEVIHLNEVIREEGFEDGLDEERDSVIADLEALEDWLAGREDVLFESHLAHHFPADRVVVLRAHPDVLLERLREREGGAPVGGGDDADDDGGDPGTATRKARENADSEALDVILSEAVTQHGLDSVYEIDTTDRSPDEVAGAIEAVVAGEREPSAGNVSFVDWL